MTDKFSFVKLDLLKELGTIGSGWAATSLSELIDSYVDITVPDTRIHPHNKPTDTPRGSGTNYYSFSTNVDGDFYGKNILLLAEPDMKKISSLLLGQEPGQIQLQDPMVLSSLKEVANILLSSYMNALSELTDFKILVGVPEFADAKPTEQVLAEQIRGAEEVLYVRSTLQARNTNFNGITIFAPDMPSLDKIFNKLAL